MERSAYLIFNPVAGQGDSEQDLATIKSILEPEFDLEIEFTSPEVSGGELARRAVENKAEIITRDLPVIMADRIQISRLIGNLIENAIENRGADPPLIKIGCSKNEDRQEYVFSVSDNGRGLNREEYERIFHLFGKEDPDSAGGVDIALHVCHKIARNHGGRLWFTTSSGKGSTFFFSIPIPGKSGEEKPEFTNIYKQTRAKKEDL